MGAISFSCTDGDVDTELCLGIGGNSSPSSCSAPPAASSSPWTQQHRQPLTIFYAGRICIRNLTAAEAGTIVAAAEREIDGGGSSPSSSCSSSVASENETGAVGKGDRRPDDLLRLPLTRPTAAQTQLLLNARPPMRRSLQRFLEKRKERTALNTLYKPVPS